MDKIRMLLDRAAVTGQATVEDLKALVSAAVQDRDGRQLEAIDQILRDEVAFRHDSMRRTLTAAKAANRALLASEQRDFDAAQLDADAIEDAQRQFLAVHAGDFKTPAQRVTLPRHQFENARSAAPEARPGSLVQIRSGQSVSDFVRATTREPVITEPLSFGEVVRAAITGRRDRLNDSEARALGEGLITGGAVLVGDQLAASIIDLARSLSIVFRAGATVIPMATASMTIAKLTGDPTAAWKGENLTQTASDHTFGALILNAKSLQVLTKASLELIEDSPNAATIIENAIAQAIALEFDRACLFGTGTAQEPRGLYNDASVPTVTLNSGAAEVPTSFDFMLNAKASVESYNGVVNGFVYNPRTQATLDKLKEAVSNASLAPPPALAGIPRYLSNQIPVNLVAGAHDHASAMITGDWTKLAVGLRVSFEFAASREAGDATGGAFSAAQVWLRGRMRGDVAVLLPGHFHVTKGILEA
jgi:HK97 family phage major capsid protein